MPFSVEVKNLRKFFGKYEAVAGISFNINKGEVFGLLGPNGAGKTTTIRMITTLLPPTSGEIKIDGIDAIKNGSYIRNLIGYVPQALSADSTLTGYENLLFVAKLLRLSKKEREERINHILEILNLSEAANRIVKEYSGGMVRKLEIGQALIHRPKLLILDEPTVGLDPVARRNVWEVLEALRKETGLTILITTHYMEEAEAMCDRVAIMNKGRIVALGTPEELKAMTGNKEATLEDVFTFFTGNRLESGETSMKCDKSEGAFSALTDERRLSFSILSKFIAYIANSFTIAEMEIRKLHHDPTELFTRAVQPALWLLVFGQAFSKVRAIPTGNVNYQTFMTPGILAQSMMFISIFYGLSIIWDKDQGILQKLIALPVPRFAFVTGKALGAGVRAISQVMIILFLSLLIGIKLHWSIVNILMSVITIIFGAIIFSSLSMAIAAIVKTRERFMGIGQVITMPLFFASNAIYPIEIMPHWLQIVAQINPLSYIVELLRGYLLNSPIPNAGLDWLIIIFITVILQLCAALLYPRIVV